MIGHKDNLVCWVSGYQNNMKPLKHNLVRQSGLPSPCVCLQCVQPAKPFRICLFQQQKMLTLVSRHNSTCASIDFGQCWYWELDRLVLARGLIQR